MTFIVMANVDKLTLCSFLLTNVRIVSHYEKKSQLNYLNVNVNVNCGTLVKTQIQKP